MILANSYFQIFVCYVEFIFVAPFQGKLICDPQQLAWCLESLALVLGGICDSGYLN